MSYSGFISPHEHSATIARSGTVKRTDLRRPTNGIQLAPTRIDWLKNASKLQNLHEIETVSNQDFTVKPRNLS